MRNRNPNQALSAYIVSSFDDHQNEDVADCDKRREYISGFSGLRADVVITNKSLALWTPERYLAQANSELDCDWTIFDMQNYPSITDWIGVRNSCVFEAVLLKILLKYSHNCQQTHVLVLIHKQFHIFYGANMILTYIEN